MNRANYLPAPHAFNLSQACRVVVDAFGANVYLVGSCMERRDYRDVDVRCILPDEEYARLFTHHPAAAQHLDPLWSLLCSSISLYLSQHSGLPIDFQIQSRTKANAEHKGSRQALGLFFGREP